MKQEIKDKWVAALRSGEYKQGKNRLRTDDTYCCLGVLCAVYSKETGNGNWGLIDGTFIDGEQIGMGVPPMSIVNWAEFNTPNPNPRIPSKERSLAELNDKGFSFNEIADLIEKEL